MAISVKNFFRREKSDEFIEAIEDTIVQFITYDELEQLYRDFPEFNIVGRKLITEYYVMSEERNFLLRKQTAQEKFRITQKGLDNLVRLDQLYENGTIKEKREIVGSIFPENLSFDGEQYRTARLNEAVRQIYLIESELDENENGTSKGIFDLCRSADWTGLEPATSAVTGRHSNQLNYQSNLRISQVPMGTEVRTHAACRAFGARRMRNFRDGKDRGISFFSNEL